MLFSAISLVFLFLAGCIFIIFLLDTSFGNYDFSTSSLVTSQLIKIIKDAGLEKSEFYDLGSCRGGLVVRLAKALPNLKLYGVDNSWFRTFCAKVRTLLLKNVVIKNENIFNTDISSANIVYIYLPQELMFSLQTKLQKELKPGALVISHRVSFPVWQVNLSYGVNPNKLYVYKQI